MKSTNEQVDANIVQQMAAAAKEISIDVLSIIRSISASTLRLICAKALTACYNGIFNSCACFSFTKNIRSYRNYKANLSPGMCLEICTEFRSASRSPTDFGWLFEETTRSLSPVTVPLGIAHVPNSFYNPSNVSVILRDHVEQNVVGAIRHSLVAQFYLNYRYLVCSQYK